MNKIKQKKKKKEKGTPVSSFTRGNIKRKFSYLKGIALSNWFVKNMIAITKILLIDFKIHNCQLL